ncbi:MAG: energy transducer TonB [Bacteroidota bacterium]
MEAKKTPKADLRRKSGLYFNLGLVIAIALTISAFEWKSYNYTALVDFSGEEITDDVIIPITVQPPPPPPPPKKVVIPEFEEVDNDEELEDLDDIIMIDSDPDLDIEIPEFDGPTDEPEEPEFFTIVERMPEPDGGMSSFYEYVSKKMKYPSQARRMGIEGRVFVQFFIEEDGSLSEVTAIKGIGAGCDEEAVRVLKNAPKWKPGKQRGRPVKVKMIIPIVFSLN